MKILNENTENFVDTFLKQLDQHERDKKRPPPPQNSFMGRPVSSILSQSSNRSSSSSSSSRSAKKQPHQIKTFYIEPNTSALNSTVSSSRQPNYSYENSTTASPTSASVKVRPTTSHKSSQSFNAPSTNNERAAIPERLIKSAPVSSNIVTVYSKERGKDSLYLRTKMHYVDMSTEEPKVNENEAISLISNPSFYVRIFF